MHRTDDNTLGVATAKANRIWGDLVPVVGFVVVYNLVLRLAINDSWAAPDTAIYWATGFLIVATLALVAGYLWRRQPVPLFLLLSSIIVGGFGLLGILLQDKSFLYVKPTIQQLFLSGVIFASLAIGKNIWKTMFESVFDLPDFAWRTLAIRWALFFVAMAVWNECLWRYFAPGLPAPLTLFGVVVAPAGSYEFAGLTFGIRDGEVVWANWKLGNMAVTCAFAVLNTPYMLKHLRDRSGSQDERAG